MYYITALELTYKEGVKMVTWKLVGDGLYQRFDDGVGQNFYIGRCGKKGKAIAWQGLEMVDGDFE